MIYINHDKKAIFIHIPKTGGTYIGPTLVKYYGFISYLDLTDGNLRFSPTWDYKIDYSSNLLKSFETNNDTINGKLTVNFNQEKTSLNYTIKYYFNLYFTKL